MIKISKMAPIPANSNPFHHDHYHNVVDIQESGMIIYSSERVKYLILIDTATGTRRKLTFTDDEDRADFHISYLNAREGMSNEIIDPETVMVD